MSERKYVYIISYIHKGLPVEHKDKIQSFTHSFSSKEEYEISLIKARERIPWIENFHSVFHVQIMENDRYWETHSS